MQALIRERRVLAAIAFVLLVAVSSAQAESENKKKDAKESGVIVEMVPMRDGVKLAADIDIPKNAPGPLPTLLVRSPYGRTMAGVNQIVRSFIGQKYVIMSQDTRGRGDSEGENIPFLADQDDGYDTVEWIAKQPWSDGRVAMIGGSALAITAYQASIAKPPHLKCIIAVVAPANIQSQAILWGGQLRQDLAIGWTVGTDYPISTLTPMTDHPQYDDFAKKYDVAHNAPNINVPMLHIGGWFDIFTEGTIEAYRSLQNNGAPGARGMQRLIIGPWTHAGEVSAKQGQLEFPANANIMPMVQGVIGWMNKCMDGKLAPDPLPVQYYLMGDIDSKSTSWNVWRKSVSWPPPETTPQKWFLTSGRELSVSSSPAGEKAFTYKFDPTDPVKTAGGGNLTIGTDGPVDQREVENRPDVILFDSPVFDQPLSIAGPVFADLTVSTTGCDTDFTAKLTDVYPDGRSMLIIDGIARARFREGYTGVIKLAPRNGKMKVRIYIGDTAYVFNKGHRMRIAISSSNHPRFSVNPNTCEDAAFPMSLLDALYNSVKNKRKGSALTGMEYETVENTLYTNGADPSTVTLQLMPAASK